MAAAFQAPSQVEGKRLRVLALMKYGAAAASTRQRLLQYLPHLSANGVDVEVNTLFSDQYVRAIADGRPKPKIDTLRGYSSRLAAVLRSGRYDVLWVHLEAFPRLPLEPLVSVAGTPVIVDIDDGFHISRPDKCRSLWERAALCICGNETLAGDVGKAAPIAVIPTVLDTDIWRPRARTSDRKVIGWIGSPSNWRYVEPLLPVIREAVERHGAIFRTVGAGPDARAHGWIDARPWSEEAEVSEVQAFDIGIMPLADDEWTRRKCGYKLIQYMACAVPVVASPVGVNRQIAEGAGLLPDSGAGWLLSLDQILTDDLLARRLGQAGRRKVKAEYSLASQQDRILDAIRGVTARSNRCERVISDFGKEWAAFDQSGVPDEERRRAFDGYFSTFPLDQMSEAEGFDLGCGSGRWAELVAPRVGKLHCFDPSPEALAVARSRLAPFRNVTVGIACASTLPLADRSQDFGYCLGVLHHIPDPQAALDAAVRKLRPGAPFLVYIYYALENRPVWFRALWRTVNLGRKAVSRLPFRLKKLAADVIAATIYWPLARLAPLLGPNAPLAYYARASFYTMRTDALDRFGTRLEQRFTRPQIEAMLRRAGLTDIRFNDGMPYWVAWGRRADRCSTL